MKRIVYNHRVFGFVFATAIGVAVAATALAASNPTPTPTSAVVHARVFNDCPTSTLTVVNNFPAVISFDDQNVDCFGFANLHVWRFSTDGTNEAPFDNNASFRFSATFKIEGSGNGEGGLQISPWWSHDADGLFNVRSTDGEIAVFGGRLPFYSFTAAPHNLHYVKGTEIGLAMIYEPRALNLGRPATVEYRVTSGGTTYTSGPLAFDQGNLAEDPPHGLWGMLNDGRVGGHFKAFLGQGSSVGAKATFSNVKFTTTPEPNAAFIKERVFNDCPTSNLTTVNNYPALVSFDDQNVDCFGFANLHVWHFSEDGGANAAIFNNNSRFRFSADFKIEGTGNGEGGLSISPWWSHDADGLFNVRSTDGEVAVFGGRLPFFSFTAAPNNVHYSKGNTIHLEMVYSPNGRTAASPATVEYRLNYQGNDYTSGPLNFDQGNPAEDPPYGQYGMLNDGQAGGHFKAFLGQGNSVGAKATFSNIHFSTCDHPLDLTYLLLPFIINSRSHAPTVDVYIVPPAGYMGDDIDVSSVRLNGLPVVGPGKLIFNNEWLKVKFDRSDLVATLPVNVWTHTMLTGTIGGNCFEATCVAMVKAPRVHHPVPNAVLSPGATTDVLWETDHDFPISSVTVLSSYDDGANWNVVASGLPNNGKYKWHVPNSIHNRVRLAVEEVYEMDEDGAVNHIDVAESDDFSIGTALAVGGGEAEFALRGATPNPGRSLIVSFSLPNSEPASLAVYDVSGRQVQTRDVGELGPGRHTVSLASKGKLPAGVYLVQLTRGTAKLTSRAVVIE